MLKKICDKANIIDFDYKRGFASPLGALAAATVFVFLLIMLINVFSFSVYDDAIYLEDSWELSINGQKYKEVDFSEYVFPKVHRGDRFVLRTSLPEMPYDSPYMQIRIWSCVIEVNVGGVPIFDYGKEAFESGTLVGGGYQWITLPSDTKGETLEINLLATENSAFTQFSPPIIYSAGEMMKDFVRQNSSMCIIGTFLFALGLISLLFAAIFLLFQRNSLQIFWISLLSLNVGLWVLCRYGLFQLISSNVQLNYYTEYLCLFLTSPLALLCIYAIQDESGKQSLFTRAFIGVHLSYVPILVVLHALDIVYIAEALRICHLFIFSACIFVFCYCFRRRNNAAERIKLFGVVVLTAFSVMDLALFMWDNAMPRGTEGIRYSMAAIGSILFIIILFINYGFISVQNFYSRVETAALKKMVYTDPHTGLANRAKANEVMKDMDEAPNVACGMLLFDLNHLKETNDRLGHAVGDTLICSVARVLADSFDRLGTVARIGGDEFVVLFSSLEEEKVSGALVDMNNYINKYNEAEVSAPISVAFGKAFSWEITEWNTEKLYRLADERMYACKENMKSGGFT